MLHNILCSIPVLWMFEPILPWIVWVITLKKYYEKKNFFDACSFVLVEYPSRFFDAAAHINNEQNTFEGKFLSGVLFIATGFLGMLYIIIIIACYLEVFTLLENAYIFAYTFIK